MKENIKVSNNKDVSYCPERGGIVTSLKLKGKEILYFDEETFKNKNESIRGGIPILFPNAGELKENNIYPYLKRHGFARDYEWKNEKIENGFKEVLHSNEETKKIYPFDFIFSVSGKFEEDGSFTFIQEVENKEEEKEMPISMGLHPYFKVPNNEKGKIRFNFEGGEYIQTQIEKWVNGEYVSIDNPKVKDNDVVVEVSIPSLGTIKIDISTEYQKIWIWSMPEKDFICIEPVMRDNNGLLDNPEMVKPKGGFSAKVNFKLLS